jgi:hypothetical protein
MRLWSKRGTDKPIEIFIALFVILAVAMVILKMFSSQIEEKRKEMETQQQEERARMAQADLDTFCATKCSNAFKSMKDKVTFCTSYYQGEIDINKNSMPDYTMLIDNIQGYCEDRIYCAAYQPCGSLDIITCKQIVCNYLRDSMEVTTDEAQAQRLVGYDATKDKYKEAALFNPGECWTRLSEEEKKMHWFYTFMAVPDINDVDTSGNYLGGRCFLKMGTCLETHAEVSDTSTGFGAWSYDDWAASCPVYE